MNAQQTNIARPIKFDFNSNRQREEKLKPLCLAVLERLPGFPARIYCYIAVGDDENLQRTYGKYFRGFGTPFRGSNLPNYLFNLQFDSSGASAFESLIYIRESTCSDTRGFVLTFAHELQHIFQYFYARKLWAANTLLYHNVRRTFDPNTTLTTIDIPHEKEANVVSKRVAVSIYGEEGVREFADEQTRRFTDLAQRGDADAFSEKLRWEFFQKYGPATPFDLLEATKPLVDRYREQILAHDLGRPYGLDFRKEEWWK